LWESGEADEVLSVRLPSLVEHILTEAGGSSRYDAILVDEGQDFRLSWWSALRKACTPSGEMLLVADATQDVYGTASAWTDEAMKGAGFSGRWAELEVCYRLPDEALDKAAEFAALFLPDSARILPRRDQSSLALEPCDLRWVHVEVECAVQACVDEILRMVSMDGHEHYAIADLTFLCSSKSLGQQVVASLLESGIRCVHTFDDDERQSRRQKIGFYMGDARVKATTLHSFKGWESRSLVIYVGTSANEQSLALTYTGLTRIKRHPEGSSLTVVSSAQALRHYGETWPDFSSQS
jgi:hypothetical protein